MSQPHISEAALQFNRRAVLESMVDAARTVMGFNLQQYSYDAGLFRYYFGGKVPKNGQYEPMVECAGTRCLIHDYDWGVAFHWHWDPDTWKVDPQAVGIIGHPDYVKVEEILDKWSTGPAGYEAVKWLRNKMFQVEDKYTQEPMYRPKPPKKAREAKSKLAARDN